MFLQTGQLLNITVLNNLKFDEVTLTSPGMQVIELEKSTEEH